MNKNIKGSVTVFLALVLSSIIFLIVTLSSICVDNMLKVRSNILSDVALNSVLGEYSMALKNKYNLLYIDTSYLTKEPSINNLSNQIMLYLNLNLSESHNLNTTYWGNLTVNNCDINEFQTATAKNGGSVRYQAVKNIVKNELFPVLKAEVDESINASYKALNLETNYFQMWDELMYTIEGMELPKEYDETLKRMVEVPLDNPALWVYDYSKNDISYNAHINLDEVGSTKVDIINGPSNNAYNTHSMSDIKDTSKDEFISYIINYMSSYKNYENDKVLGLELEYIVNHASSDIDNLRAVIKRILDVRVSDNFSSAILDGNLYAQALEASSKIKVCVLDNRFIVPVAMSMVYAAAYLETVSDIYSIFNDGAVPLVKNIHHFSINDVLYGNTELNMNNEGLKYRQYLIVFLNELEEEALNLRTMDVMEFNIKNITKNNNFKMNWCIERFNAQMNFSINNKDYHLNRIYGYY